MRDTPIADIIQLVCGGNKSGVFHVEQDTHRARIHLRDGRIVHAVSSGGHEGMEALLDVAFWLDGTYRFEEGALDTPTTITKSTPGVLSELGMRMDEWRVLAQKIPSVDLYPVSTLLPGEEPKGANPREVKLLDALTGYYTVAELAEVMQRPLMKVAKDLYGLVMAGHVTMKGVRSGRPPKIEGAAPAAPPAAPPAMAPPMPPPAPQGPPMEETAIVRLAPPPPVPVAMPASAAEPFQTVGGGVAGAPPVAAAAPAPAVGVDPLRLAKLTAYTQRIAGTAKAVLPLAHHNMIDQLQASATQQLLAGDGPDAVKNLALAISKGAVDAGVDADTVRNLNAQLKAIFAK
ncbi:MAG TPA: DUF4388 domain-containing protein [Holophagaceae bacterium]|nr:DUF4388 domain-containing protein [Holophagaceae bacterium]